MQEEVGLQSATDGEFRRASWHMDFIYEIDGISKADGRAEGQDSTTRRGRSSSPRRRCRSTASSASRRRSSARTSASSPTPSNGATPKLTIPSPSMVHYRGGAAAIDPDVYPDQDAFWADLTTAYAEQVRRMADAGLHLPPVRRHQPGLPQRPQAARADGLRAARTPSTCTRATSATSTRRWRPPRGHGRDHAHVPRELPLVVGGRGRLRLRGRGAVQRASTWTASSSSTTTRARAASSRCGSCRRASWWCSAS